MSADYKRGRLDGLREAALIVANMRNDVDARLAAAAEARHRGAGITRHARRVRSAAYAQAVRRITTRAKQAAKARDAVPDIAVTLKRLGL